MGYFSELDLKRQEEYKEQSYPSFEEQLLWRCEALKNRYRKMVMTDAPFSGEDRFSREDYLYAPIKYFETITDVFRAMEIAEEYAGLGHESESAKKTRETKKESSLPFVNIGVKGGYYDGYRFPDVFKKRHAKGPLPSA